MELPTRYTPAEHEGAIYDRWEKSGAFQPKAKEHGERTFTIMIPPPNVTGVLHMGHAMVGTVEDIVIRYRRMLGDAALWVPGTDHAGIATQAVVERKLLDEQKKTRKDLGRPAFEAEIWKWKEQHGSYILQQLRRLGSSCDWTRTRFTLEPAMSRAVREAFVRLFDKGLVYRGARLVNWDCVLQTAVSDDEIEYVPRKDKLYSIRYPVKGRPGEFVTVATTRPETMLGDTGVCVHPDDERYRAYHGSVLLLPLVDREIPLVLDDGVEREFGTGAVKVTPGHDPADYERGAKHNLPIINLYEKDGRLNENAGPYKGLSREKARDEIVKKLDELGLLAKVEPYEHNVAVSDRSKSIIEPLVSEQWFVKMKPLAGPAIRAMQTGALKFRPERWTKVYLDWLENVRDWCISRQLWWGHQIPVWYDEDGVPFASRDDVPIGSPHPKTGKPIVRQDEDVLDTWASSWLWPFATLGWPDLTDDLARFYPTQFLSTAREIIYLWVARMVMAGYEFLDHLPEDQRCPFEVCYVNATVLDGKGRRMSKSLGNGIDPIEMIDKYGADAVRYSLILLTKEGQDVKLSPDRFEQGWRFGNKVWNAARFVLMKLECARGDGTSSSAARLEDRWILSRLAAVREEVSSALEQHRYNDAATALYRFVWNDFCDWYLEIVKPRLVAADDPTAVAARGTLARVLSDALAMLHPFTPYMTEVLWQALNEKLGRTAPMLISGPWPDGAGLARDAAAESEMQTIQDLVRAVRSVRLLTGIAERKPLAAHVAAPRAAERGVLERHAATVKALAFLESCEVREAIARPPNSAVAVAGALEAFVPLSEDVDLEKLRESLSRRAEKVRTGIAGSDAKLANAAFVERADPEIVAEERARRAEMATELALLEKNVAGLGGINGKG
ncbi:MAG TPA: valine--tRNA ligase [Planctomycetota bacterium]|nr:valine--tRNA ligase [Planctomycetota bacterium]